VVGKGYQRLECLVCANNILLCLTGPPAPFQGLLVVPVPGLPLAAAVLQVLLFSLGVEMFQRGIIVGGERASKSDGLGAKWVEAPSQKKGWNDQMGTGNG
jgi:hypothetical protein